MTAKQHNIPVLRFPEFSGEWERKILASYLIEYKKLVSSNTELPVLTSSREGLMFQKEYYNGREIKNETEYNILPRGYFTYRHMSDDLVFKFNINTLVDKGVVSKEYPVFTTKNMDSNFLWYKLNYSNDFKKFAITQKLGGTRTRLYYKNLKQWKPTIPALPEQQKIADFLGAVDKKITQLNDKKDALERYKKGVMQKLFAQEIRFTDDHGHPFPDWEEKKLGDVGDFVGGGTPDTTVEKYWNGEIQWFTPTELKTKYVTKSKRTLSLNGLKSSSAKILPVGTLLISTRATVGDVSIANEECTTNQGFQSLSVNKDNDNEFFYYLLNTYKKEILKRASGSTFLEISKMEIQKIIIKRPSLPEQQRIADFLSVLDQKIEAVANQITHAQGFKKSLLQKMFV